MKTIRTSHIGRSVYCKFVILLFLLAALCGGRGSTGLQDFKFNYGPSLVCGTNMGKAERRTRWCSQHDYVTINSITYWS